MQIKKAEPKRFRYREMKESNWTVFSNEVSKLVINGSSIDEKWANLCTNIKAIVEKSFPEEHSKSHYTFVMSQGLLKSKNKKNRLLKQYKRGLIEKEVYTRYNNIYRKLITKEQENAFSNRIIDSGQDSKKNGEYLKRSLKFTRVEKQLKQST
jgi:hypothetical protein